MIQIIPVTENNFEQAVDVYTASWGASHIDICTPAFLRSRDYAGYLRKRMDGLRLIVDEIPVGVFYLLDGEFGDLYIHPQHMGKGYGTAAIQFAKEKCTSLHLTVLSTNTGAVRLYERMGFRFSGNEIPLKNGIRELEMRYMEKHNG